ncbi:MAG: SGNH/GDSL hydrolase family protein [Anaerolineales bacterium]
MRDTNLARRIMKSFTNIRQVILTIVLPISLTSSCTPTQTAATSPAIIAINTSSRTAGIGILGDSTSDEYRADDVRGGLYAESTLNWVELLAINRGLNFGKWGTWGEPRRTGYEYNWARSGATTSSMISSGQHTGLARQIAEGKVSYVIMWIGNNDFQLNNGTYEEIYNGTLNHAALQEKIARVIADITLAMDTILQAGDVKMTAVSVGDQGITPQAQFLYPDPRKRERITEAINSVNAKITELAEARGIPVLNTNAFGKALFARVDLRGYIDFNGRKIYLLQKGNEPHHLQLEDDLGHAGTVLSGMIANSLFIEPFNAEFGLKIPPLTDDEILRSAGIE